MIGWLIGNHPFYLPVDMQRNKSGKYAAINNEAIFNESDRGFDARFKRVIDDEYTFIDTPLEVFRRLFT